MSERHEAPVIPPRDAGLDARAAMIDCARPLDAPAMCELYPTQPDAGPLADFHTFNKKFSYAYGEYYAASYNPYIEPVETTANVYHNLMATRDYYRDDWKAKYVAHWNEDDTLNWVIETARCNEISELDFPYYHFKIPGEALRGLKREDIIHLMSHPQVDPEVSNRNGNIVFDRLQSRLHEELRHPYADNDPYLPQEQAFLDLDSVEHKSRTYATDYRTEERSFLQPSCDSNDDTEDMSYHYPESTSPEYASDVSKSGDEMEDKRKLFKRPPGRPKGSGRKMTKRPKSVSVPEFLRNLLLDPQYCPSIIKWEDHSLGKFRFVKPDEVAKLWGKLKQNDNMTFEKFSRAMRYHYRQSVLESVPTARLVYKFGHKGPDFHTDNPNFLKLKSESDIHERYS